jgi:hypothetical protein
MMSENLNKISRPRQLYVGKPKRDFVKLDERTEVCFVVSIKGNRVQGARDADEFEVVQPNETVTIT